MIDIRLVRTNPELVKENIRKKFQDEKLVLVDEVLDLDKSSAKLVHAAMSSVHSAIPSPRRLENCMDRAKKKKPKPRKLK